MVLNIVYLGNLKTEIIMDKTISIKKQSIPLVSDTVEFMDDNFVIIKSIRLFAEGFNCYRKNQRKIIKINNRYSCFGTFEDAKIWLDTYKNEYI